MMVDDGNVTHMAKCHDRGINKIINEYKKIIGIGMVVLMIAGGMRRGRCFEGGRYGNSLVEAKPKVKAGRGTGKAVRACRYRRYGVIRYDDRWGVSADKFN